MTIISEEELLRERLQWAHKVKQGILGDGDEKSASSASVSALLVRNRSVGIVVSYRRVVDPSLFTVISFVSFQLPTKHNQSSSDDGDEKRAFAVSVLTFGMRTIPERRIFIHSSASFSFNRRTKHRSSNGAILASSFPVARECSGESPLLHIAFSNSWRCILARVAKRL
jgi:hypothetical protein